MTHAIELVNHPPLGQPDGVEAALAYGREKSRQDIDAALAWCTDDFVLETVAFDRTARGAAAAATDLAIFFELLPDYAFHPEGHARGDGFVVLWGRATATWTGRLPRAARLPRWMRMPPRAIDLPAVAVFDVRDGRLGRERFHFDLGTMSAQMRLPVWLVRRVLRRLDGPQVIRVEDDHVVPAPVGQVFERYYADPDQLRRGNPRFPWPHATRVELVGDRMQEGALRRVHLWYGHVTDERIDECDAPYRLRYRILNGWGPPLDLFVAATGGVHELEPLPGGRTRVRWRGEVVPTSAWAAPVVGLLARILVAPMQRRFHRSIAADAAARG